MNNIISLNSNDRQSFTEAFKLTGGTLVVSLITNLTLRLDVAFDSIRSEFSFTENTQLLFIALTIYTFFRFAHENPALRHAAALIIGFFCVLFIRECDGYLDYVYHGFWLVPALTATAIALFFGLRDWKSCIRESAKILASPGLLVISGTVLLLVYSRLFGMGAFWQQVMGDIYLREVKVVAEEGSELLAYGLIFWSALLTRSAFKRKQI